MTQPNEALKTSADYIEVLQCDLDFEEALRGAYAINGPVCSLIAEFREQHSRTPPSSDVERLREALIDWRNCWLCPATDFESQVERLLSETDAAISMTEPPKGQGEQP